MHTEIPSASLVARLVRDTIGIAVRLATSDHDLEIAKASSRSGRCSAAAADMEPAIDLNCQRAFFEVGVFSLPRGWRCSCGPCPWLCASGSPSFASRDCTDWIDVVLLPRFADRRCLQMVCISDERRRLAEKPTNCVRARSRSRAPERRAPSRPRTLYLRPPLDSRHVNDETPKRPASSTGDAICGCWLRQTRVLTYALLPYRRCHAARTRCCRSPSLTMPPGDEG